MRDKRWVTGVLVFLVLSFLLSGNTAYGKTITVQEKKGPQSVLVGKKDTLQVILAGNPTAGYQWTQHVVPPCLKTVESRYVPDKVKPGVVGSGGRYIWRYKAVTAGKGQMAFWYARPWESVQPKLFSVQVIVK